MYYQVLVKTQKEYDQVIARLHDARDSYNWRHYPYVAIDGDSHVGGNTTARDWRNGDFTNLTLKEFFAQFPNKVEKSVSKKVVVPNVCSYTCTVYPDKIEVGCQTITWASVQRIVKARTNLVRRLKRAKKH